MVGFAPGGGTDTTARALTPKLTERFGQQVIVDNRPGAAGNIATDIITKSPADGYTILMGTIAALAINPTLYGNLPFDPLRDLAPVTRAVDSTNILVVHPSVEAKTVKDLIALAKTKSLNGGSSGVGGAGHLALELFNVMAGTKITHVPYKGGGPAMVDLLGGQINSIFATAASASHSGRSAGYAQPWPPPSKPLSSCPTCRRSPKQGYPGFEAINWYGVVVPAKHPVRIIDRLNKDLVKALAHQQVVSALHKTGTEPKSSSPEESALI